MPTNSAEDHAPASLARRTRARAGWVLWLLRRHWLVAALLGAGLALRVAAQAAYRPALFYIDSIKYVFGAYPGNDPPGYELLLKPALHVATPAVVAAVQHVLGLGMALTLYLVLTRRGAPRWLSALATAPILLDAYQVQIEQTIMPDTVFEALIVAGLAALLWRPRPPTWAIAAAGLALGASATIRQVGEAFILPGLLYLLVTLPRWRHLASRAALYTAAFALPILGASFTNYISPPPVRHHFSLAPYAQGSIYGRLAAAADCATLTLPSYERPLCPTPAQKRLGPDGLDHSPSSPIKTYLAPAGMSLSAARGHFTEQVLLQQPGNVASAIAADAVKLFAVRRVTSPGDTPISRWQFQTTLPRYPPYVMPQGKVINFFYIDHEGAVQSLGTSAQFGGGPPVVVHPLARFLRAYQLDGGYTPGPLLLLCVLAGLAGSLSLLRRRLTPAQRDTARACLLTFTAAAAVLLASDVFEFSWRYQLPALITLPPAAALGLTALTLGSRRLTPAPRERGERQRAAAPGRTGRSSTVNGRSPDGQACGDTPSAGQPSPVSPAGDKARSADRAHRQAGTCDPPEVPAHDRAATS